MKEPLFPANESDRLNALSRYDILYTPEEEAFDGLTGLAAHILDVPIALVSLIDEGKQWFKSHHGIDARETPRAISFCGHVVAEAVPLIVEDALEDERFADNPLVIGGPKIRFYAGIPLRTPDGFVLGTLCAIDREPRRLEIRQIEFLNMLANQVVAQLELRRQTRLLTAERMELLASQRQVQERESRLQALFESMAEGVVEQNMEGQVLRSNKAAETILGLSEEQLRMQTAVDPQWMRFRAATGGAVELEHPALRTLQSGKSCRNEIFRIKRPDGEERSLSMNAEPLRCPDTGETLIGIVTTFRDITEQLLLEESLEKVRDRAARQERLATTGTLAAGVGHEINNPLTFVIANVDLALEEVRAIAGGSPAGRLAELIELLEEARQGSERVRKIVRGLRAFVRDDGLLAPTDLRQVVDISTNMANHELRQRATVSLELEEVLFVLADESRLSQVLVNLLVNAGQAFETNDPKNNQILIRARRDAEQRVVIEVSDNGPGIPLAIQPRIFDPFYTTKPVGVGTGLGLSISMAIIATFDGELICRSELGQGTTFQITLNSAEPTSYAPVSSEVSVQPRGRVLVIDDEAVVLKTIQRALQKEHDVICISNPHQIFTLLHKNEQFDAILCDLMMPSLPGFDLFQRVREIDRQASERFVFMTGGVTDESIKIFLEQSPNGSIEKPFSVQKLRKVVRQMIRVD